MQGGVFWQLHDLFSSIKPVLDFFGRYCPTPQYPPPPPHQKSNGPSLRCYQVLQLFMWWKNLDIYVLLALLLLFSFILPIEFRVIISGSKKQQKKDSFQSEVPFSVIRKDWKGRTPWKQRMTRKEFTANSTRKSWILMPRSLKRKKA